MGLRLKKDRSTSKGQRSILGGASHLPSADDLIALFNEVFGPSERTMLVRGEGEPVYRPWTAERPTAEVVFAHGFPSSALHEVAHWCIAGRERRKLQDFGYWYHPDGRSMDQQRLFESVEVKPQALEWIFSVAAGLDFHFSADNLAEGGAESTPAWEAFQDAVARQARTYVVQGLPPRARLFASRLSEAFATGGSWMNPASYARAAL